MIINDRFKNYALIFLAVIILILLFLMQKKENQLVTSKIAPEEVAKIIIESKFLLPDDFKAILKTNDVTGLTIGFKNGDIALLTPDGQFINPCNNGYDKSLDQKIIQKESRPCRFEGSLTETHALLAQSGCPSTCQGQDGMGHVCKSGTTTYGCHRFRGYCAQPAACP
jgi:hypothetical protein